MRQCRCGLRAFILIWLFTATATSRSGAAATPAGPAGHDRSAPERTGRLARGSSAEDEADALRYEILIRLDPEQRVVTGDATIEVKALNDLSSLTLDLGDAMQVSAVRDAAGSELAFERPGDGQIVIRFPVSVRMDEETRVRILYAGPPDESYFSGHEFFHHHGAGADSFPMISTLSQPNGSHLWWPCRDRMDDKALVTMSVETPQGYVVASNGTMIEERSVEDGWKRTTWRSAYPIAPYLVAFAATNYATWSDVYRSAEGDSIPLQFYAYPEDSAKARVDWQGTGGMIAAYEHYFGPYPFGNPDIAREKLGVAEFSWNSGAMEHQTCVFMGEGFVTGRGTNDWALAHEIAHQWWGDAVTPVDMDHIWLNEGFATYCEALYREYLVDTPAYLAYMQARRVPPAFERNSPLVRPDDWFSLADIYLRGSWVLHMLRGQIGDQAFFASLNEYFDRHAYGNADTDDFVRAVEETTARDLRWFFIPWLYGTGRPEIAWDWWAERASGGGHRVRVYLRQTQEGPLYPKGAPTSAPQDYFSFWIDVRVTGDTGSFDQRIYVDGRDAVAEFDVPFEPTEVELDPDQWLLREVGLPGEAVFAHGVQVRPNPLATRATILVQGSRGGDTSVKVYDVSGRLVRELGSVRGDGIHLMDWDGNDGFGEPAATGQYFVRSDGPAGTSSARVSVAR